MLLQIQWPCMYVGFTVPYFWCSLLTTKCHFSICMWQWIAALSILCCHLKWGNIFWLQNCNYKTDGKIWTFRTFQNKVKQNRKNSSIFFSTLSQEDQRTTTQCCHTAGEKLGEICSVELCAGYMWLSHTLTGFWKETEFTI